MHSAQCAMMCAVHACTGWNGPPCSWWGEGRCCCCCWGERVFWVRETDDLPATVWWGVRVRHSQFAHLHSALHACGNLVHLCVRGYEFQSYVHFTFKSPVIPEDIWVFAQMLFFIRSFELVSGNRHMEYYILRRTSNFESVSSVMKVEMGCCVCWCIHRRSILKLWSNL
jgi:hypothetical protein